jgi:hypothetical protein
MNEADGTVRIEEDRIEAEEPLRVKAPLPS